MHALRKIFTRSPGRVTSRLDRSLVSVVNLFFVHPSVYPSVASFCEWLKGSKDCHEILKFLRPILTIRYLILLQITIPWPLNGQLCYCRTCFVIKIQIWPSFTSVVNPPPPPPPPSGAPPTLHFVLPSFIQCLSRG